MTEHYTAPEFTGLSCDATGCAVERRTDPLPTYTAEVPHFMAEATAEGWTIWAGRSRRVYCPAHGPKPGHQMRDVTKWGAR